MKKSFQITFILVLVFFFSLFFIVSVIPHTLFKTYALDLGMLNHALYSYSHFKSNTFTLEISGVMVPFMNDHFSPIMFFYAPFYYIFGHYTLLIIQIVAILFGGYGIFRYALYKGVNRWISLLLMVHFLVMWGIFSALSFDFHNNVIAAMLIPWFVYYFDKGNYKLMFLFFVLVLISKENMALWMAFILLALIIRKEQVSTSISKPVAWAMLVFSALYFVLVIQVIMPALNPGVAIKQLGRYSHLGGSVGEIIENIYKQPAEYFAMLFENTLGVEGGNGVKGRLLFLFIVSGGFAVFTRPYLIVMLLPIYAQKMLGDDPTIWGAGSQYSIEFMPIISLAVISLILSIKSTRLSLVMVAALIFTSIHFNWRSLETLFSKERFHAGLDVKEVKKAIRQIPDDVPISVSSELAPHLASRDQIYHFPIIQNSRYIALLKNRSTYPLRREAFDERIRAFEEIPSSIVFDNDDIIIVKVEPGTIVDQIILSDPLVKSRLEEIEQYIRNDKDWFRKVEEKAKINGISVDSMLKIDAMWSYKRQTGQIEE